MATKPVYFSSQITDYSDNEYTYFGLPVYVLKIALTYLHKPTLNNFEQTVISLLLIKKYTSHEIAEKMLLNIDFVEMIINNLIARELLDTKMIVTDKGRNLLTSIQQDITTDSFYMFYDCFQKKISEVIMSTDYFEEGTIKIKDDSLTSTLRFSTDINNYAFDIHLLDYFDGDMKNLIKKNSVYDLVKHLSSPDFMIKQAAMLEFEQKQGFLIVPLKVEKLYNNAITWKIMNASSFNEIDYSLNRYFHTNDTHQEIHQLILKILQGQNNFYPSTSTNSNTTIKFVTENLFDQRFPNDEIAIVVAKMIDCLVQAYYLIDDIDHRSKYYEASKAAMIALIELFELVLYSKCEEIGFDQGISDYLSYIGHDPVLNSTALLSFAKQLGFQVNESHSKMVRVTKSILQKVKNSNYKTIEATLSWCLIHAMQDNNHFLRLVAVEFPNFIQLLNIWKSEYRNPARHTTEVKNHDLSNHIKIALTTIEIIYSIKLNNDKLEQYLKQNQVDTNYSIARFEIQQKMGNSFMLDNNPHATDLRFHLVSAYKQITDNDNKVVSTLRSIVEDYVSEIILWLLSQVDDKNWFVGYEKYIHSSDEIEPIIEKMGFKIDFDETYATSVTKGLMVDPFINDAITGGLRSGFIRTNLRPKLLTMIFLLIEFPALLNRLKLQESALKNILDASLKIAFIDKNHHQVNEYDNRTMTILFEEIITICRSIYVDFNLYR